EKETSPPRHYTIETLNNYLKNPFKDDKKAAKDASAAENADGEDSIGTDDSEDYRAIFEGLELGTEATRTGIIDNAKKSNYIQLKKDVYTILPDGEYLIEALGRLGISMDKYKTSELGKALKRVFRGKMTVADSVKLAEAEIAEIFRARDLPPEKDTDTGLFGDEVGTCPLCGGTVRRTSFGYGCGNYREKNCRFSVREVICGRPISIAMMRLLLSEGKTGLIEGFVSPKSGKSFDAYLTLSEGRAVFVFPDRPRPAPTAPTGGGYVPPPETPPYPENPLPDWAKSQP
ncbi:MAG: topoisomerase C-terminal repeat-containing protein, partial [Clostridia bacterium]|nr:topoisomerase C-terminal repeat-containing protein [Clostridia bacterium]